MQNWNTDDHRISGTDHGTLYFTDDTQLVVADWEATENAPDSDGRVYARIRGWLANGSGSGRSHDPYTEPVEAGRARLVRSELRGRQPLTDLNVHVDYYNPGKPYPNTWDHRGCIVTVSWMDRRIDANGQPIPEDEIGRTQWTNPATGENWDLTRAYIPAGKLYFPDLASQSFTWRHFDRWSGGIPVLHPFYGDAKSPSPGDGKLITDGQWVTTTNAPRPSEH